MIKLKETIDCYVELAIKKQLEKLVIDYLNKLSSEDGEEFYGSSRTLARYWMLGFIKFVTGEQVTELNSEQVESYEVPQW